MKPGTWKFHPREQMEITNQRPADIQQAVGTFMEVMGDQLVEIALGRRMQPGAPPMGGVVSAIEAAVAQALIFAITNEDRGYVLRRKLVTGTPAEGLLVAQLSPQEQARLAQATLKREDPKR